MKRIKSDERGDVFEAQGFKIFYRKSGSISGDNEVNPTETIYLLQGEAEVTLKNKVWIAHAPERIDFPEKTYHKIKALDDITFLVF